MSKAIESVNYMAQCTKQEEESDKVKEDWKFVAMVLDRLFLWIFSVAVIGDFKLQVLREAIIIGQNCSISASCVLILS